MYTNTSWQSSFSSTQNWFHYRLPDCHKSKTTPTYKTGRRSPIGMEKYSQPVRTIIITDERHCFPFPQSLAMLYTYVANHRAQPTILKYRLRHHSNVHTHARARFSQSRKQTMLDAWILKTKTSKYTITQGINICGSLIYTVSVMYRLRRLRCKSTAYLLNGTAITGERATLSM
jgi:hypothetical protein